MGFRFFLLLGSVLIAGCFQEPGQLFNDAERRWREGDFEKAVALHSKLVRNHPHSRYFDRSLFRLGETYLLNLDDDRKAVEYFRQVAEGSDNRELKFRANAYMADVFWHSFQNYDLAIIQFQKLINEFGDPDTDDDNQFRIAECYFQKGDYRQAIVEYQSLLEKYPDSDRRVDAQFQMANSFFVMGDCGEALNRYQTIREQHRENPHDIDIQFGIASCKEEQGDYQEAIRIFQSLQDRYPNRDLLDMKIRALKKRV